MKITLHGLHWQTETPSCFHLLSLNDDVGTGGRVVVTYGAGDEDEPGQWWIVYLQPGRLPIYREFPSRDDAMALIASRRVCA